LFLKNCKFKAAGACFKNQIYEPVKTVVENYKNGFLAKEELLQVREYYFKKYMNRILEGIY